MEKAFEIFEQTWAALWAFLDKLFIALFGEDYKTPDAPEAE